MRVLTLSGTGGRLLNTTKNDMRALKSEKLDLRLTPEAKQVLQSAAAASRRSVSDFVLESALSRAEEALADRRTFGLNAEAWKAFVAALDAAPRRLPRMETLLREPGFFDTPR
jgi:uncharacterized protein (DUF1778 family)